MTSWKMKVGGSLLALGTALVNLKSLPEWVVAVGMVLQTAGGLFLALGRDNDTTSEDVAAVKLQKLLAKQDILTAPVAPEDTAEIKKLQARIESVEPPKP